MADSASWELSAQSVIPEISVIIPTYNAAEFLAQAIESVRMQKHPSLEIIIVDDGSDDATASALKNHFGLELRVIHQIHSGPAAARNRGIENAHGNWIAFLDADDRWLEGKLQEQMVALERTPDASFSYADAIILKGGKDLGVQRPAGSSEKIFLNLLLGPQFRTASVLLRRDCLESLGLFDIELRSGEDWDLWLRLAANYRGCYVPRALAVYRQPDSKNKYCSKIMEKCTLRVLDRLYSRADVLKKWPEVSANRERLYAWHYAVLAKTHLRQRRIGHFLRLALAAARSHPVGLFYLSHRWRGPNSWSVIHSAAKHLK